MFLIRYAFIEFKDEATAEKNLKLLKGKKVGDSEIVVDFVGEKAQTQPAKPPKRSEPGKSWRTFAYNHIARFGIAMTLLVFKI